MVSFKNQKDRPTTLIFHLLVSKVWRSNQEGNWAWASCKMLSCPRTPITISFKTYLLRGTHSTTRCHHQTMCQTYCRTQGPTWTCCLPIILLHRIWTLSKQCQNAEVIKVFQEISAVGMYWVAVLCNLNLKNGMKLKQEYSKKKKNLRRKWIDLDLKLVIKINQKHC